MRAAFFFAHALHRNSGCDAPGFFLPGKQGAYILGAVIGFADVDPFIMSMTQQPGRRQPDVSAGAIILATTSNNLAKGMYALFSAAAKREASPCFNGDAGLVGLIPLLWL